MQVGSQGVVQFAPREEVRVPVPVEVGGGDIKGAGSRGGEHVFGPQPRAVRSSPGVKSNGVVLVGRRGQLEHVVAVKIDGND